MVRGEFDGSLERAFFGAIHPRGSNSRAGEDDSGRRRRSRPLCLRLPYPSSRRNDSLGNRQGPLLPFYWRQQPTAAADRHHGRHQLPQGNGAATAGCRSPQERRFLAITAARKRNPLAPIRNAVQILLLSGLEVPNLQWATDVIDRQVRQMTRLVDDLLEVSRITTGKLEIRKETLELAAVIREAVETSQPLIEQGGHQLTVSLPSQPVMVNADMIRMAQVFSNLLNNAAKYTEPGGRISISLQDYGDHAVVSVKDSGTGISAEMLPHIFEMFMQVDRNVPRSKGGLGIGLTLVKQLVEMHGGSIEARSAGLGHGSEFVVRLPTVVAASRRVVQQAPRSRTTAQRQCRSASWSSTTTRTAQTAWDKCWRSWATRCAWFTMAWRPSRRLKNFVLRQSCSISACPSWTATMPAAGFERKPWGKDTVLIALTGWGQDEDRRARARRALITTSLSRSNPTGARERIGGSRSQGPEPLSRTAEPDACVRRAKTMVTPRFPMVAPNLRTSPGRNPPWSEPSSN